MSLVEMFNRSLKGMLKYLLIASCAAIAYTSGSQTSAETIPNFATVRIVRNSSPLCEPTCPEWIAIDGAIGPDLPAAFAEAIKAIGGKKLPVTISSSFGNIDAAIAIGKLIRANGLQTVIGTTTVEKCFGETSDCRGEVPLRAKATLGRADCLNVCTIILAGGVERIGNRTNQVGMRRVRAGSYNAVSQQFEDEVDPKRRARIIQDTELKVISYYRQMGVDPKLQLDGARSAEVFTVSIDKQLGWHLITNKDTNLEFADDASCKRRPLPGNCVER